MKRWIATLLCVVMISTISGCGSKTLSDAFSKNDTSTSSEKKVVKDEGMRVGLLLSGDSTAPDSETRIQAIRDTQCQTGLKDSQVVIKEKVTAKDCADKIKELIDDGCTLIFSTDKIFEEAVLEAAAEHADVQFCQEGGEGAKQSKLSNMHDYYSRIYEAYYISGILAGMKLNDLINDGKASSEECAVGFVASEKSARTISCYTAFLLGVRRMNSNATLLVRYVGSDGVYNDDGEAANQLAVAGVKVMGTYTSTKAVATVCAERDIPVVGCEESVIDVAPEEAITSAVTNWSVYYTYAVTTLSNGGKIDTDWCEGYAEDVVCISQLNDNELIDGMADEVINQEKKMRKGETKVFDTTQFTVDEVSLEEKVEGKKYKAYQGYVSDEEFHESERNSAPAFDILIDGVTVTTEDYVGEQQKALQEATEETEE